MSIPALGTELYRIRSINMNYKELCELIEAVELLNAVIEFAKNIGLSDEEIMEIIEERDKRIRSI